ncbi:MAG: Gfo/Idh/MocA family oxidoreductase [Chloroflexi bacterium]|nr:Gfo/Idh/MocA family oxidoreductase [Chloroflexota bacterium]
MTRLALVGSGPDDAAFARIAPRAGGAGIVAVTDGAQAASNNVIAAATLAELLETHSEAIDAVIVQTPTNERASHIEAAATAGKHVLVKGPLGGSAGEARQTAKACAAAGVVVMAGQIDRYRPEVGAVRASMDAGQMGQPGLVRSHRWQPPPTSDARLDPIRSGGIFIHELTRDIDIAAWLFDGPPDTVFAIARGQDPDRPDAAVVHLGFPDGGMAVLDVTTALPEGEAYWSLQLIGADGAVYADDQHNMQLLYAGGSPAARLTNTGDATVLAQLEAFVEAIGKGSDPAASIEDAVLALEVAEAAMASAASGRAATRTEDGYVLV